MGQDTASHTGLGGLDKSALNAALQACIAAIKATDDEHDTAANEVEDARAALKVAEATLTAIINKRQSLQRAISSLIGIGEGDLLISNGGESKGNTSPANESTRAEEEEKADEVDEPVSLESPNEDDIAPTRQRKRLNIRSKLVDLISATRYYQSPRDIYDLAKQAFNIPDMPDSTVNSSLSELIKDGKLFRFPFPPNAKRGSLYGLPEWFQEGEPKPEYFPTNIDTTNSEAKNDELFS
jgi:hypothetical protein